MKRRQEGNIINKLQKRLQIQLQQYHSAVVRGGGAASSVALDGETADEGQ